MTCEQAGGKVWFTHQPEEAMISTATIFATGLTTLALSACGTAATTSPTPSKPAAAPITQTATPVATQTPAEAHFGYFNMDNLQSEIQKLASARLRDPASRFYLPGVSITSTTCILSGAQTATCLTKLSDGQASSADVTISTDGQTFITH